MQNAHRRRTARSGCVLAFSYRISYLLIITTILSIRTLLFPIGSALTKKLLDFLLQTKIQTALNHTSGSIMQINSMYTEYDYENQHSVGIFLGVTNARCMYSYAYSQRRSASYRKSFVAALRGSTVEASEGDERPLKWAQRATSENVSPASASAARRTASCTAASTKQ